VDMNIHIIWDSWHILPLYASNVRVRELQGLSPLRPHAINNWHRTVARALFLKIGTRLIKSKSVLFSQRCSHSNTPLLATGICSNEEGRLHTSLSQAAVHAWQRRLSLS